MVALVGLVAAACGGDGGGGEGASGGETTTSTRAEGAEWERVEPGGDCQCADGSEFHFWVREGDSNKVLLHFGGGGACWSAETCAQPESEEDDGLYKPAATDNPMERGGIFDVTDERNPFADWSIIFVPYCTADVFLGNATTEYAPGLTIQHKGYVNGTAAVDYLAATFPDATQVVVTGLSAGAVSAPVYGGLVSDQLPEAEITVLSDGAGGYTAAAASQIAEPWGVGEAIPDWPENAGLTAEQWASPQTLYIQAARHDPDITFARHDYAYDRQQAFRNELLGVGSEDLLSTIDANEAQIEAGGVNVASYTAPGDDHGVLQYPTFYTEEVDGQKLVDWVSQLVAGEQVDDVHCTQCAEG